MKQAWFTGVSADLKDEIRRSYNASATLRKRLKEILEKKQDSSWNASIDKEGYDSSNWAFKQADARGYERALKEVISLISSEK